MEKKLIAAIKNRYRFETTRGVQTLEDVFHMPLKGAKGFSLNDLAVDLNRKLKDATGENFVDDQSMADTELENKFEIVKYVIAIRKREAAERAAATERAQEIAKIREVIKQKKETGLGEKSLEELENMLKEVTAK
jgi:hypothetical protein